jgi:hypothetical protein
MPHITHTFFLVRRRGSLFVFTRTNQASNMSANGDTERYVPKVIMLTGGAGFM